MEQRVVHMEINFDYIAIQKLMLQTNRVGKVNEIRWGHLSNLHVFFLRYDPQIG